MIGAYIFVLPGLLVPFGTAGIAVWAVAIPGALILAAVVSRLVAARPQAAGAAAVIGEALGPLAAVLIGWSYWVGIWSANAILAQTAIRYASVYEPRLAASPVALAAWSIALIWLLTLLNLRGAVAAGRFQVITTLLKLLPLIAVIAIAAGLASKGTLQVPVVTGPIEFGALTGALALSFGAMVGFESASVASERVRDPARNVPRATLIGVALTGLLYFIVCLAIASALPAEQLAASAAPVAEFVEVYWGRTASLFLAAFAVIAAVGCLNGWIFVQGEHPLAMVRGGLLPKVFGKTTRRDVAIGPLMAGSVCCSILLASDLSGSGGLLAFMINLTTAATVFMYFGCCVALWALRAGRLLALLGMAFCTWVLVGTGEVALLSLALMLSALPLYWWARRSLPKSEASAITS
jgi:basic amino acid/polyamine antiporter, APA family